MSQELPHHTCRRTKANYKKFNIDCRIDLELDVYPQSVDPQRTKQKQLEGDFTLSHIRTLYVRPKATRHFITDGKITMA